MRGKYSPTVKAAYMADKDWHHKFMASDGFLYDQEGFDSYGYNADDCDRAGNNEYEYMHNDADPFYIDDDFNWKYDSALNAWGFDGTKPVYKELK